MLLDRDHDGQVTSKDLTIIIHQITDCLAFNLPAGTGFTAGLAYGLGATLGTSWKAALLTGVGGRLLLSRVAVGGLTTTGSPAAFFGLQRYMSNEGQATGPISTAMLRRPVPGYCLTHFLGEPEERCKWSPGIASSPVPSIE